MTAMTSEQAQQLAADTKIMIDHDFRHINQELNNTSTRAQLLNLIQRQNELLTHALARIEALEAENSARQGDGK